MANNINQIYAFSVVDQLLKFGINKYYVSPGLRNAPIISALTKFKGLEVITDVDERSASYRALGRTKASGVPTVLVCTSGTAHLNYAPAIAEAAKTNAPIIVISADRPSEMVGMNTNQTLNQLSSYEGLGVSTHRIETPNNEMPLFETIKNFSFYIYEQCFFKSMPAHINLPFRGQLDDGHEKIDEKAHDDFNQLIKLKFPLYQQIDHFIKRDVERPLVLIGDIKKTFAQELLTILKKKKYPHICDITSGLKLSTGIKENSLPSIDHPEIENFIDDYAPTSIIQIGERFISKKYDTVFSEKKIPWYLFNQMPKNVPNSNPTFLLNKNITEIFESLPVFKSLDLNNVKTVNDKKRELIETSEELTLPLVSKRILDNSTEQQDIFIGNSSAIRSFDYYINIYSTGPYLNIHTNRGVSGIEGNIATITGICETENINSLTAVLGDISFLHDLTSLKGLTSIKKPIKIFVINDHKGGIFGLLPLELNHESKEMMATTHEYDFKHACLQFGVDYELIESKREFELSLSENINRPKVYEINIKSAANFNLYQKLKTMEY